MPKKALITGITGQDGSYLAELLLSKDYEVHGIIRRSSSFNTERLSHLFKDPHDPKANLFLHYGNLVDSTRVRSIIQKVQPDELYNLAAQSHVKVSFEEPEYTADVIAMGTLRLLDGLRDYIQQSEKMVRYYQASSSEMFGSSSLPLDENSPFYPSSPYAVSKVAAHFYAINYRKAYGMFISNGILFNHESPRRGETFVTRKITRALGRIKMNLQHSLYLGNIEAKRDWGFSGDYVEAMWLMLQQHKPDDYVIATGETHSVRDFLDEAANYLGLNWHKYVEIDERYFRPSEVDCLNGNAKKANEKLGWKPKTSFKKLVRIMVDHDLELARKEAHRESK
ncbi:GDP-mannose 4,6-dehydratase [Candidatus Latescibacterota bacterium]